MKKGESIEEFQIREDKTKEINEIQDQLEGIEIKEEIDIQKIKENALKLELYDEDAIKKKMSS